MALKNSTKSSTFLPRQERNKNLSFLLVATANKIVAGASLTYKRHFDIGIMEWRVLDRLAAEPSITAKTIAQLSGVDKAAVSRAASSLSRRGYLLSVKDKADNRATRLALTKTGKALFEKIVKVSRERDQRLSAGLRPNEHKVLCDLLQRIAANIPLANACEPTDEENRGTCLPYRVAAKEMRAAKATRGLRA